ncbi:MAG: PIG-L family deacetylase, partial [Acidobacteriota bacterium]|nr:PIG-L family deacetylase [Acidobacteriota bacterium]
VLQKSPLADVSSVPIQAAEKVLDWGKTVIVAPHPDDESLGCGGAIALLRKFKRKVKVLVLSDGTLSHPNSVKFPLKKLRELREMEMLHALEILGVPAEEVTFFRYRDRSVPNTNSENWLEAVGKCRAYLRKNQPETILVPWRRDPHPDHRAAYSLIKSACKNSDRIIEYPIWLWEIAESVDAPRFDEVFAWRLDISRAIEKKQRAIRAHASQTTDLIDDDLQGFRLTEDILANFAGNYEFFLEEKR